MRLVAQANSDRAKYDLAERAYREGEIPVATRIYVSLMRSRIQNPVTVEAKRRLDALAHEARGKVTAIDAKLSTEPPEASQVAASVLTQWQADVRTAFDEYDTVLDGYGNLPSLRRELTSHVSRQRRKPEYAAVLNEAGAKRLWELGRQQEQEDRACCAYWLYKDAARLQPAPSALRAAERIKVMEQSPEMRTAAQVCRDLQECHKMYKSAEWIQLENPDRARQLLAAILKRAPADSEVYRAAEESYAALPR